MWQETIRRCLLNIHKKIESNDNKKINIEGLDGIVDISFLILGRCNKRFWFIQ